jgi:hypothetical protein
MDIDSIIVLVVTTLIGLVVRSLYSKVSKIPSNDDLESIRVAVSGVKKFIEEVKKEDSITETKQWTKLDNLSERVGKLEGQIEGLIMMMRDKHG